MIHRQTTAVLYDPRIRGQAIRIQSFRLDQAPSEPPRTNYFTIVLIESGSGSFWADASQFAFGPGSLLFFVPYQFIRFAPDCAVQGSRIQFHANFLCIETFHAEVGCSGILFNDPYGTPSVTLDAIALRDVSDLFARIDQEQAACELAFNEAILAYLKVLLILATRLKTPGDGRCDSLGTVARHPTLARLRDLIEENYRVLHSPADYARALHLTPKTLGRLVRDHLGTTLTDLIRGRILTHAKWQLLHTLKPVKEIARELGFNDELYFSRLFKKATGYSPTFFRDFETEIREGSNLSMFSADAPILPADAAADS